MSYRDHEHGKYKPVFPDEPLPNENWAYPRKPFSGNDKLYGYKGPKFERHIYIRKDQVFFDIETQLNILAKARKQEDGTENEILAGGAATYHDMFCRWIDKCIGTAKATMSAFVLENFQTAKMNSISQEDEIDIELRMPDFWDDTVFEQLCQAVHDYIVNETLHQFFIITLTSKDTVTFDKGLLANEALEHVQEYCNSAKPGFIKKSHNPF